MNKLFSLLLCFLFISNVNAQSKKMSSEGSAFQNGIVQFLKEEGYVPTIDEDDNSVNFKKEGERYWIIIEDSSPLYIEFHKTGFTTEDTNINNILEACNYACYSIRSGKAYMTSTSVNFTVEVFCSDIEEFKYIFYKSMSALDAVKERTKEYYNDLDE